MHILLRGRSVGQFIRTQKHCVLSFDSDPLGEDSFENTPELPQKNKPNPFFNVNTPEQLEEANIIQAKLD